MNSNHYIIKTLVSSLLVISYFMLPKCGFTSFDGSLCVDVILSHLLYPVSHANVWHLAANIMCLWMIPCRIHLKTSYWIAVACSFIPAVSLFDCIVDWNIAFVKEPTMGFSGIIFAIVGISWGKVCKFREMLWKNKWYLIVPAFLPHINFLIHFYCLVAGFVVGFIFCSKKICVKRFANL